MKRLLKLPSCCTRRWSRDTSKRKRRFKHFINLPDYTAEELFEIFEQFAQKEGFTLTAAAREKARGEINKMSANRNFTFGSAKAVRILFEKTTGKMAQRIFYLPENQQDSAMFKIEAEDI